MKKSNNRDLSHREVLEVSGSAPRDGICQPADLAMYEDQSENWWYEYSLHPDPLYLDLYIQSRSDYIGELVDCSS